MITVWAAVGLTVLLPVAFAAASPFLAYRTVLHIVAGFAGIACLGLFLIQPLLAGGYLPGFSLPQARKWHRRLGGAIVAFVVVHVGGLYLVSPSDALDALLLVAPTPFSLYGVIAMWGVFATAVLVLLRRRLGFGHTAWAVVHNILAAVVVLATIIHALQIDGAMEIVSKWFLCAIVAIVTSAVVLDQRVRRPLLRRR